MGDEIAEWIGGSRADVDQVVAEYGALPECTACGGSGKDDHATAFEAPLAVHFAGPPVEIAGRRRQLCMWCGHVLRDIDLAEGPVAPWVDVWPVGKLVRLEDGVGSVLDQEPGAELPPGCCALPDDEPGEEPPAQAADQPEDLGETGPDEAQETRAAADWPAEPADQRWDERELLENDPGDAIDGGASDEDGDRGA
ncbi:hypothetical protein [Amycolatopsis vancoresmycina]|uniref:Uncharacterized protein n=1 Tax=Amycolatopsis vancoresmycina DSM 44592 TaxID=1292037 RepID=R1G600_9PSEU|nr:hypothetical protein [Amycolatopsis vancoresmycina]EOD66873.1 hypothetical protein H480_19158 [Amycolatopsis vancoresmycina DSM 44592]